MASLTPIPPIPDRPPTAHLSNPARKPPRTLKGDLKRLREKAVEAGGKLAEGRARWTEARARSTERKEEIRAEAETLLGPAREKVAEEKALALQVLEPLRRVLAGMHQATKRNLDAERGRARPWSTVLGMSAVVSWVFGPQVFVALYDRAVLLAGRSLLSPGRDASVLAAGHGADWGVLHGPGRWFRDTLVMAGETGRMANLYWAAILGVVPLIILFTRNSAAAYLNQCSYKSNLGEAVLRWLTWAAYGTIPAYLVLAGHAKYTQAWFGFAVTLEQWQIGVAALFCTATYCTMWVFDRIEARKPLGYTHVLLMTPTAAIVTGALLNAPDAAW